jgi:hypothetical protein
LFTLENDPDELRDCASHGACAAVIDALRARLRDWFCARRTRTMVSNESVEADTHRDRAAGVFYGFW